MRFRICLESVSSTGAAFEAVVVASVLPCFDMCGGVGVSPSVICLSFLLEDIVRLQRVLLD